MRGWAGSVAIGVVSLAALVLTGCGSAPPACMGGSQVGPMSATAAERSISQTSPGVAALALRYEPTVRLSAFDRFWPVSVASVLRERGELGNGVMLVAGNRVLADPPTLADLKPSRSDAASEYLAYPANLADKAAQMRVFLRGLGVSQSLIASWPTDLSKVASQSAQIYFYDGGTGCSYPGADTSHYHALEYWFFYGFNYYPMTVDSPTMLADPLKADSADVDLHEGDWEHISVLVDQQGSPHYVWMARHSDEGTLIPWDHVQHDSGGHPIVYPAFGGHPSYPDCGAHARALLAAAVYDYVPCAPGLYTLSAANTRLVDLAHVSWSCWPGFFGTTVGTNKSASNADDPSGQILVAGPGTPLRQMENQHVCSKQTG